MPAFKSKTCLLCKSFVPGGALNSELAYEPKKRTISSFGDFFEKQTRSSRDPRIQEIAKRYTTHYDFEDAFAKAAAGKLVMAESKTFLSYNLRDRFTNQ